MDAMEQPEDPGRLGLDSFVALVGRDAWQARIDAIVAAQPLPGRPSHCARDVLRRHAIEIAIERGRRPPPRRAATAPNRGDARIARLAAEAVALHDSLPPQGRRRLRERLAEAMLDGQSLFPLFHLVRTGLLQRSRGFAVEHTGLAEGTPFDLRVERQETVAEIACDTISADAGRDVQRGAWVRLADMVDPDLQTWLAAHPGRYLLNITLPKGLGLGEGEACPLAELHGRIKTLLAERRRAEHDPAVVMRLDPLILAGAQAEELGIVSDLRRRFGPDAHLAVTVSGGGVFVMAAQPARANDVPAAVRRRLEAIAGERSSGGRPAILSMYIADTDLGEWRRLLREMSLEGEVRQFLARPAARHVAAVACTSRHEMLDAEHEDAEIRFRSPLRTVARLEALAPAILSSN